MLEPDNSLHEVIQVLAAMSAAERALALQTIDGAPRLENPAPPTEYLPLPTSAGASQVRVMTRVVST